MPPFPNLLTLHRSRGHQVGKVSGCLLGGNNFYPDFSPSLCTQFKVEATKPKESLLFWSEFHLSISLIHTSMVTSIPQYLATEWPSPLKQPFLLKPSPSLPWRHVLLSGLFSVVPNKHHLCAPPSPMCSNHLWGQFQVHTEALWSQQKWSQNFNFKTLETI